MPLVVLLFALFASVFTIAKFALGTAEPFFLVGSRMIIAGVLLLSYQYCFHRAQFFFHKKHIWRILRLSLFNIYLTNVFEFWGLQYLTSFKTCFIYSLSPFISALLCFLLFSEKLSRKKWIGLIVGFGGILPVLLSQTPSEELGGQLFVFSWAELTVMAAATTAVYGWILLGQLVRDNGYSPMMANGLSMLFGGIMALVHSSFIETWNPIPVKEFIPYLECTLLLIVISNLICYNLYGFLLKRFSTIFMSFAGFITPFFTALLGWFFLGEVVTWPFYVSAVLVFLGLLMFYREELSAKKLAKVRYMEENNLLYVESKTI